LQSEKKKCNEREFVCCFLFEWNLENHLQGNLHCLRIYIYENRKEIVRRFSFCVMQNDAKERRNVFQKKNKVASELKLKEDFSWFFCVLFFDYFVFFVVVSERL
jgi:hypothetical protein